MNKQSDNYIGVLLEEMSSKLDVVIEIVQSLRDTKADKDDFARLEQRQKQDRQLSDASAKRFNSLHLRHIEQIEKLQKQILA